MLGWCAKLDQVSDFNLDIVGLKHFRKTRSGCVGNILDQTCWLASSISISQLPRPGCLLNCEEAARYRSLRPLTRTPMTEDIELLRYYPFVVSQSKQRGEFNLDMWPFRR
jgi:hypothetical protein